MNKNALQPLHVSRLVTDRDWEHHREEELGLMAKQFAEGLKPLMEEVLETTNDGRYLLGDVKTLRASVYVTTDNALQRAEQEESDARMLRRPELVNEVSALVHCHENPGSPLNDPKQECSEEQVKVAQRYLQDYRFHRLINNK